MKVVVTTAYRGVFFGELVERNGDTVKLAQCRNCLYWSRDVKGFVGLATTGPSQSCRIGPAADEMELFSVASITKCTDDAAKAWESAPWS